MSDQADPVGVMVEPDAEAIARFQSGDVAAFDELVQRYQKPIYYLALRHVRNEADASDVVQMTFVRVFKGLAGFRGESLFRTWIYRIAVNLSLNHLRDNRREQAAEIREDALTTRATGPSRVIRDQEAHALRDAIASLPPKQRLVLELRVFDEMSFREVAEVAECSENAAKVNFHHAVKRLRVMLGNERSRSALEGES